MHPRLLGVRVGPQNITLQGQASVRSGHHDSALTVLKIGPVDGQELFVVGMNGADPVVVSHMPRLKPGHHGFVLLHNLNRLLFRRPSSTKLKAEGVEETIVFRRLEKASHVTGFGRDIFGKRAEIAQDNDPTAGVVLGGQPVDIVCGLGDFRCGEPTYHANVTRHLGVGGQALIEIVIVQLVAEVIENGSYEASQKIGAFIDVFAAFVEPQQPFVGGSRLLLGGDDLLDKGRQIQIVNVEFLSHTTVRCSNHQSALAVG